VQEKVTEAHFALWHWPFGSQVACPYLTHFVGHNRQNVQESLQVIHFFVTALCLFVVILFFFVLCHFLLLCLVLPYCFVLYFVSLAAFSDFS
jgi:hypothetical protein